MAYDPVNQGQHALRRLGQLLRRLGVLPEENRERHRLEGEAREELFARGYKQVEMLAAAIEEHAGCTLEGRTALDFGCGFGRLALPLAECCEHVYGLDISPEVLREADRNAARMNISNVEWMDAGRLAELDGRYDMVLSRWVFQHIPSRQGEQIFAALLHGLRPGGVGALHFTVRPIRTPLSAVRELRWSSVYLLMNSYSLSRLGSLLADAGITDWHVRWHTRNARVTSERRQATVTLIFRKGSPQTPQAEPT
jgi:2-polyprenyl-3-methyl-5-hydroxy-6-metoxy-1,4-benzoquinol methylase